MQLITDGTGWPRPWENALLAPPANCITYNTTKSIINLNWGTFYARALLLFQTVNCSALEISITLWHPTCISLIAFFSLSLPLLPSLPLSLPSSLSLPLYHSFSLFFFFLLSVREQLDFVFLPSLILYLKRLFAGLYKIWSGFDLLALMEIILLEGFKTLSLILTFGKKMYV